MDEHLKEPILLVRLIYNRQHEKKQYVIVDWSRKTEVRRQELGVRIYSFQCSSFSCRTGSRPGAMIPRRSSKDPSRR